MHEILALVLHGMHADLARLDRVAMNLANAQTIGYKRELAAEQPFAARIATTAAVAPPAQPQPVGKAIDLRPGTLRSTGQPLDLALGGPGWFEVETAQGVAYTRQGNFRLDASGRLVTQQGLAVLGLSGAIQLAPGAPRIDGQGRVFEAGATQPQAQLRIVDFAAAAVTERVGDGLVRIQGDPQPVPAATELRQGFLENSNVEPLQEMLQMLQSVRHMEMLQKVALGYDEMLAASIRRLGEGA